MCISTNATIMIPLSAQDVCFNGGGFMSQGCNGGQITSPWSYLKKGGLFGGKGAVSGGQYQGSGPFGKGLCSDFSLPHCHHHAPRAATHTHLRVPKAAPTRNLLLAPRLVTPAPRPPTTTLQPTSTLSPAPWSRPTASRASSRPSWPAAPWKLPSLFTLTSRTTSAASTTTSAAKPWVATLSRSSAGAKRTVSSTGRSPTPGTLTGARKATSASVMVRVVLMTRPLALTPMPSGARGNKCV